MEAMTEWERWAQNMRLQFTTALLGGRLLTMPKQILSLPAELGAVPGNQAVNLTRALKYMGEFKNVLWRKVQKGAADKNLLEGTKTADLISKHAPWIWRRHGGEPEVAELDVRGFSGLAKKIRINGRPLGEVALMGLKRFDLMTVATGFQVAYDAVYEIEMNKSGDPTKADVRAGEFAGDMIRDFHPPSLTVERNYAQRGSELIKGAMPFSGQTQKNLQMFQYRVLMPLAQAYKKGGAPSVMRALVEKKGDLDTSIAQRAVYMAAVPALVMGFLARRRPPDEVEAMQDLILYPLSSVPIIGPAILFGSMYGDREPAMTPSYLSFAATTISVLHDVASKEIDLSGKTGRDSLRAIDMWTGLPDALLQIARIASKKMVVEGMSLEDITAEDYLEIMGARIKEPRE